MLVLGHTGIVLGAGVLLAAAFTARHHPKVKENETAGSSGRFSKHVLSLLNRQTQKALSWLTSLGNFMDIRLLLVGAVLPDIIDKPIGHLLFRETFSNGRIFGHTLLFLVLVSVAGFYLYKRYGKTWLLAFSFGTSMHLLFDQMWRTPQTLFWPLFGFAFPKGDISDWITNILHALVTEPQVYIPELVGGAIIIWFTCVLLRRGKIYSFIRHGRIQ